MASPRTLPLFDERLSLGTWSERMQPGEYAVHFSHFEEISEAGPYCLVFDNLQEATAYSQIAVVERPTLRCSVYDHRGRIGPPIADIRGTLYKGEHDFSPRVRRWLGAILLFGGLILILVDWISDFELMWPGMIGVRIWLPGLILLFTDPIMALNAKWKKRRTDRKAA